MKQQEYHPKHKEASDTIRKCVESQYKCCLPPLIALGPTLNYLDAEIYTGALTKEHVDFFRGYWATGHFESLLVLLRKTPGMRMVAQPGINKVCENLWTSPDAQQPAKTLHELHDMVVHQYDSKVEFQRGWGWVPAWLYGTSARPLRRWGCIVEFSGEPENPKCDERLFTITMTDYGITREASQYFHLSQPVWSGKQFVSSQTIKIGIVKTKLAQHLNNLQECLRLDIGAFCLPAYLASIST